MELFRTMFLEPEETYWAYVLKVAFCAYLVAWPISYLIGVFLPEVANENWDNFYQTDVLTHWVAGLLYSPVIDVVFIAGTVCIVRHFSQNIIIAAVISMMVLAVINWFTASFVGAVFQLWPSFAASISSGVALNKTRFLGVVTPWLVLFIYNLLALIVAFSWM